MKHISLFSGIGGFDLAAEWMGWENVAHCEWNPFGQKILKYYWPNAISYEDITKTDFTIHRGNIDILTGGFPCQDASIAKQDGEGQQGLQGSRTGLLFEMCRAIREIQPNFVVAENVENILKTNRGEDFRTILSELASMGYNAEWRICRASEVGAPHQRARLYIIAYTNSFRLQKNDTFFRHIPKEIKPFTWKLAGALVQISAGGRWLSSEPPAIRLDHGFSHKLAGHQIKGYGNAVVPEIPYRIFKAIEEYETLEN